MSRVYRHPKNRLLESTLCRASKTGLDPVKKTKGTNNLINGKSKINFDLENKKQDQISFN